MHTTIELSMDDVIELAAELPELRHRFPIPSNDEDISSMLILCGSSIMVTTSKSGMKITIFGSVTEVLTALKDQYNVSLKQIFKFITDRNEIVFL